MMKHPLLFFALLLLGQLCFVGCRKDDAPGGCQPLGESLVYPEDSIVALSSQLNGDCLQLSVDYRGGCANHNFALYWSGAVDESLPPQVVVQVLHDNGGDTCDEIQTAQLSYDLARFNMPDQDRIKVQIRASGLASTSFEY